MKLRLNLNIDVEKIAKERLYKGQKGTYLNLTTFIDTEQKDKYDHNGFVTQVVTKEEREAGVQLPILGNTDVVFKDYGDGGLHNHEPVPQVPPPIPLQEFEDIDVPF